MNRSTYYKFLNHQEPNRAKENAHKLSNKIDTQLAIDTVNLAVAGRGTSEGIIFHTDRGCRFTAKKFRKHLDSLNMVQSFSAKGHPYDNAVMECFFKYLKKEETDRKSYCSFQELSLSLLSTSMVFTTL